MRLPDEHRDNGGVGADFKRGTGLNRFARRDRSGDRHHRQDEYADRQPPPRAHVQPFGLAGGATGATDMLANSLKLSFVGGSANDSWYFDSSSGARSLSSSSS